MTHNPWGVTQSCIQLGGVRAFNSEVGASLHQLDDVSERYAPSRGNIKSLKMMGVLTNIETTTKHLRENALKYENLQQSLSTEDVTAHEAIALKIQLLFDIRSHLDLIVDNKELVLSRLQQPHCSSSIPVHARYHKVVVELFETCCSFLPQLEPATALVRQLREMGLGTDAWFDPMEAPLVCDGRALLAVYRRLFEAGQVLRERMQQLVAETQEDVRQLQSEEAIF